MFYKLYIYNIFFFIILLTIKKNWSMISFRYFSELLGTFYSKKMCTLLYYSVLQLLIYVDFHKSKESHLRTPLKMSSLLPCEICHLIAMLWLCDKYEIIDTNLLPSGGEGTSNVRIDPALVFKKGAYLHRSMFVVLRQICADTNNE